MGYLAIIVTVSELSLHALGGIWLVLILAFKSWRPLFKIQNLRCVSTYLIPAYLGVAIGVLSAHYLAPSADRTTDDQESFIAYLRFVGFALLGLHTLVLVPIRLYLRRTICRWQGLILCEISKATLCATLIVGLGSLGSVASSAFIFFGIVAIVGTMAPLIGRLAVIYSASQKQEGSWLENFQQIYFGVPPEDQQPPLWACEQSSDVRVVPDADVAIASSAAEKADDTGRGFVSSDSSVVSGKSAELAPSDSPGGSAVIARDTEAPNNALDADVTTTSVQEFSQEHG